MASKSFNINKKSIKLSTILLSLSFLIFFVFSTSIYNINFGATKLDTHPPLSQWFKHLEYLQQQFHGKKNIKVGLVNVLSDEKTEHDLSGSIATTVHVRFKHVPEGTKWEDIFPVSIDEDKNSTRPPSCPEIPMPALNEYGDLDVVVAELPCNGWNGKTGWRDVFRLQVNLVVANVLVTSGWVTPNVKRPVYAVFVGQCGPMPEIFGCKDLVKKVNDHWVYKPDLRRLKQKVLMPVGSCQLARPYGEIGKEAWRYYSADHEKLKQLKYSAFHQREAYATVLHSSEAYVCGAIALAQSLLRFNPTQDLVLLHDEKISSESIEALGSAGWKTKQMERIRSPFADKDSYNEKAYSKLRIWMLAEYDKVVYIDADVLVLKNLDWLFVYPQLSAASNNRTLFSSGVIVVEPALCTFEDLMTKTLDDSYGDDQGFLNEVFTWWHRLPSNVNFLKDFKGEDSRRREKIPDELSTIHYLGLKPWACYKDYDCNWDKEDMQIFASDKAHETWWQVHDEMPVTLQRYCRLTEKMNWRLKKWRWTARNLKQPDEHWKIPVRDPRQYNLRA